MHSHDHCGKCGSPELLLVPTTPGQHSHIVLGERVLQAVAVTKYICSDCGHVEQWVNSKADLERLREERQRQRGPRLL
jgi:hypothetical protein